MNIEVLKIVRDNIKMGSVLSFAEVMIIQQAIDAAMLQCSQPVSNHDELQVIGWLRSDYNSDDKRDPNAPLFMLGRNDPSEAWGVKYIPLSGNSPVIPGGWVMVPKKLTAENGAKSLLSGEFLETTFISCPECLPTRNVKAATAVGELRLRFLSVGRRLRLFGIKALNIFVAAPQQGTTNL